MKLSEYIDSERIQEDKHFLSATLVAAIADAWYEGYKSGLQEGERIWRPKVPDER